MRKILYWTMERAILALFTLLLCAPPTLAQSGKVIKPQAPPGLQRGTRSLNLTPLARHRQTQARMRPPAATHLRAHLTAGKVAAVGGRMLDGAARALIEQFLNALVRQTGGESTVSLWTRIKRILGLAT